MRLSICRHPSEPLSLIPFSHKDMVPCKAAERSVPCRGSGRWQGSFSDTRRRGQAGRSSFGELKRTDILDQYSACEH